MKKPMMKASLLALLVVACSGSQKEPKEPVYEEVDIESVETGDTDEAGGGKTCTDPSGEPLECLADADCCEGFYCGIDPEGSTRIKTCIPGE